MLGMEYGMRKGKDKDTKGENCVMELEKRRGGKGRHDIIERPLGDPSNS